MKADFGCNAGESSSNNISGGSSSAVFTVRMFWVHTHTDTTSGSVVAVEVTNTHLADAHVKRGSVVSS